MSSVLENVEPLLSLAEVLSVLGRKDSWLYSQIKLGKFPAPDRKHGKKNYWRKSTVEKHLPQTCPEN